MEPRKDKKTDEKDNTSGQTDRQKLLLRQTTSCKRISLETTPNRITRTSSISNVSLLKRNDSMGHLSGLLGKSENNKEIDPHKRKYLILKEEARDLISKWKQTLDAYEKLSILNDESSSFTPAFQALAKRQFWDENLKFVASYQKLVEEFNANQVESMKETWNRLSKGIVSSIYNVGYNNKIIVESLIKEFAADKFDKQKALNALKGVAIEIANPVIETEMRQDKFEAVINGVIEKAFEESNKALPESQKLTKVGKK